MARSDEMYMCALAWVDAAKKNDKNSNKSQPILPFIKLIKVFQVQL